MATKRRARARCERSAITLLEVVLSLALIAIAMSLLAQLVGVGSRAAQAARDVSHAQIICQSVMSDVVAGILPLQSQTLSPTEQDPNWLYAVDVSSTDSLTLSAIRVTVQKNVDSARPASFSMTQWLSTPVATTDATGGGL